MTKLSNIVLIAAAAAALAGCAGMSLEPLDGAQPGSGGTAHSALAPRYPISAAEAPAVAQAPTAPAQAASEDDLGGPSAAPVGGVSVESLPPVAAAPERPLSETAPPLAARPAVESDQDAQPQLILAAVHRRPRLRPEADAGAPVAAGPVETSGEGSQTVVVKTGDTVKSIAERMGVTEAAVIKANRLRHPRDLEVGRKLKVPTGHAKAYVVQHGDTLFAISRRFGVPVPELEDLNHLEHGAHLRLGQHVALPGPAGAPAAAPEQPTPPAPRHPPRHHEAPAETLPSPAVPPPAAPRSQAETVTPGGNPNGPIPYSSLPGHLTGPVAPPPAPTYGAPPSATYAAPAAPNGPPMVEAAPPPTDAQIAAAGRGRFVWPVRGQTLAGFGPLAGGQRNDGVDLAAPEDTPVLAAAAGDVVYAGNQVPGFGNLVLIKHADGWVTAYAHLSATEVRIKDHVSQGVEIGRVGQSGGALQPELHFEIRYAPTPRDKARPVDPALVLGGQ